MEGFYPDFPMTEYLKIDALNSTGIKNLLRNPAHYKYNKDNPKDSKAFVFGRALHCAVLEPGEFEVSYEIMPKINRKKKAGREKYAELLASAKKRDVGLICESDFMKIKKIKENVYNHKIAKALLKNGCAEKSAIFKEPVTDVLCKVRADFTYPGIIVDLKTTKSAVKHAFKYDCKKYKYYIQAAFYKMVFEGLTSKDHDFLFIAVEKDEPFGVAVYSPLQENIEEAKAKIYEALEIYKKCKENDNWPGYPEIINDI